jgi:hypothetical protein
MGRAREERGLSECGCAVADCGFEQAIQQNEAEKLA